MNRSPRLAGALALLAATALPALAGDEIPMKKGLWELTIHMQIPGLPTPPTLPPQRVCLSPKDPVPRDAQESGCKVTSMKRSGATVSWAMECTGARKAQATGEATYRGDTMTGKLVLKAADPRSGQPMEMTQTMTGRRVGDCDPEKEKSAR